MIDSHDRNGKLFQDAISGYEGPRKGRTAMIENESDLELLHAYLDGELPVAECEGLWRRLAAEADLFSELDKLRAEHVARQEVWSSLEPANGTVAKLNTSILRASRRHDIISTLYRGVSWISSVAALILFGFTVGWFGRNQYPAMPGSTQANSPIQMISHNTTAGNASIARGNGKVVVEVRDGAGNLVARPEFDSQDDARQFANEMVQIQSNRQQNPEQGIVPAAYDRF
jgi:anti-sigma factor RsiW